MRVCRFKVVGVSMEKRCYYEVLGVERTASEDEIRKLDPEIRSFFNVNTPYDLEAARLLIGERD